MITYPEDSVLHRHIQSALQFTEVSIPDIPQDSVLHRHAVDQAPEILAGITDNKPETVVQAESPTTAPAPQDNTAHTETASGGGFFAWLKKILAG